MYCTCCGEVISPDEVTGEEVCADCMSTIYSSENIFVDEDDDSSEKDV